VALKLKRIWFYDGNTGYSVVKEEETIGTIQGRKGGEVTAKFSEARMARPVDLSFLKGGKEEQREKKRRDFKTSEETDET